jgi:hypothetical protein
MTPAIRLSIGGTAPFIRNGIYTWLSSLLARFTGGMGFISSAPDCTQNLTFVMRMQCYLVSQHRCWRVYFPIRH